MAGFDFYAAVELILKQRTTPFQPRKLLWFSRSSRDSVRAGASFFEAKQLIFCVFLFLAVGFVQLSLFSFARFFPHSSWASAIVFILFHLSLYAFTWYRGTTIIIVSLKVIKGVRHDAERIAVRIRLLGSLVNGFVAVGHVVTLLGTVASATTDLKFRFFIAYYAVSIVYQLSWLISVIKYYTAFISAMAEHLERGGKLAAAPDQTKGLELALAKLRRLRATFMGSVGFQTIVSIICIVLPPIGSYYIPIWQITGSFAVLSFLRELRQQNLDDNGQTTNTSTGGSFSSLSSRGNSSSIQSASSSALSGSAEPLVEH